MPTLQRRQADFGVCIHEGRFTWREQGLSLVEDLGTRWEAETNCPLPLGGIVARRQLSHAAIATVQAVIRDSLDYALAHRNSTFTTMRKYAQEFADEVLMQHVDLYVNQWTLDLGQDGREALARLANRAAAVGLVTNRTHQLEVFSGSC